MDGAVAASQLVVGIVLFLTILPSLNFHKNNI